MISEPRVAAATHNGGRIGTGVAVLTPASGRVRGHVNAGTGTATPVRASDRQDARTVGHHGDRVLDVGRAGAVGGADGPAVPVVAVAVAPPAMSMGSIAITSPAAA